MDCLGCGRTITSGTRQCHYCGYAADRYAFVRPSGNGNRRRHCHADSYRHTAPQGECDPAGSVHNSPDAVCGTDKLIIGDDDFALAPTQCMPDREYRSSLPPRVSIKARALHCFLLCALFGSAGFVGLVAWLVA